MVFLAYFWKLLTLAILASFMLSYLGFAQNLPAGQQNTLEFPADWPSNWNAQDFNFSLLEPAAGTPTVAVPAQVADQGPSPTTPVAGGLAAQTFAIDQLPRTTIAPSGTQPVAIPPASAGLSLSPSVSGFRPISQAFGGTAHGGSVAANLGIVVNEQPVAGAQSGLVGLAAYGPLSAAAPETLWLRAPQTEQQRRLKAATAKPLPSAALQAAWRQVLLADAAAPQANEAAPNWLAVRAETLEALGQHEAAWGLWREAGRLITNPNGLEIPDNLQQGWARASLLAGQTAEACSLVRAQAAKGMVSDFWPSSAAVCAATDLAQGGEEANAAVLGLAIQLLPPATLQNDPALVAALNAVRDNATPRLGTWPLGSLAGATLAAVPQLLSSSQLAKLPDVALRRLQATPDLSPDLRRTAALQLLAKTNAPNDAAQWLALASSPTLPKTPQASWPEAATLAWAKAYVQAAVADPSATLPPSATVQVVGAALRLNDLTTALSWWGPYRAQEGLSPAELRTRWQYYLTLQLAQGQPVAESLNAWSAVRGDDALANRRTLAAVAGMGQQVAPELWVALNTEAPEQADTLNLAWQNLIMDAAKQPDRVAVLAMVSEALRGQNAAALPPAVLQSSLAALRAVGLETTAQRLAAEALTLMPTNGPRVLKMTEPLAEVLPTTLPAASSATLATPTVPTPKAPSVKAPKPPLLPKPKV